MVLDIKNFSLKIQNKNSEFHVLQDINLKLNQSEILGIVGESGSGKSMLGKSIMQLVPKNLEPKYQGSIFFEDNDLLKLNDRDIRSKRGKEIALISQEPMASFNPLMTMDQQFEEVGELLVKKFSKKDKIELLESVKIRNPEKVLKAYPHELSGGMLQRIMIAKAMAFKPKILLADEPTTALDVTIQSEILKLLVEIKNENGLSIILISHDLKVIEKICDKILVMYCGRIVEENDINNIFSSPLHHYTKGLLHSYKSLEKCTRKEKLYSIPGSVPELSKLPSGCNFQNRCNRADNVCKGQNGDPKLVEFGNFGKAACFHPIEYDEKSSSK